MSGEVQYFYTFCLQNLFISCHQGPWSLLFLDLMLHLSNLGMQIPLLQPNSDELQAFILKENTLGRLSPLIPEKGKINTKLNMMI